MRFTWMTASRKCPRFVAIPRLLFAGRQYTPLLISQSWRGHDRYYVAYKAITLSCILFMFIEMKFIHCHSCVRFAMKSMSM